MKEFKNNCRWRSFFLLLAVLTVSVLLVGVGTLSRGYFLSDQSDAWVKGFVEVASEGFRNSVDLFPLALTVLFVGAALIILALNVVFEPSHPATASRFKRAFPRHKRFYEPVLITSSSQPVPFNGRLLNTQRHKALLISRKRLKAGDKVSVSLTDDPNSTSSIVHGCVVKCEGDGIHNDFSVEVKFRLRTKVEKANWRNLLSTLAAKTPPPGNTATSSKDIATPLGQALYFGSHAGSTLDL